MVPVPGWTFCYLFLPNRSCHFPLAPPRLLEAPLEVPAGLPGTTSSSTVSRMVDTIEIPCSGFSGVEGVGERSIKAFEVFFCRRAYVLEGVLRRAEVSEDSSVRLGRVSINGTWGQGKLQVYSHGSRVGFEEGLELWGQLDKTVVCVGGYMLDGDPARLAGHGGVFSDWACVCIWGYLM